MTLFALFPTAMGECGIAWRDDLVVGVRLPDVDPDETPTRLAAHALAASGAPPPAIGDAIAAMTALLAGEPVDLTPIACDFGPISPFAQQVYYATRAIPVGETWTYGGIAAALGDKRRAREVGAALGRNPLPIIVPCHRVLGANGRLTGFSAPGGVATKLRILAIEGARFGDAPALFDDLPLATRSPSRTS